MTQLTNLSPASSYPAIVTIGTGYTGLSSTLQQVGDGIGNYSPLYLSTTSVNINTSMGPFMIGGVALTVTATQINTVCSATGLVESVNGTQNQIFVNTVSNDVTISLTDDVEIVSSLEAPSIVVEILSAGHLTLTDSLISTTNSRNINLVPDGTAGVNLINTTNAVPLRWYDDSGTNYVSFQAGNLSTDTAWTLPVADSTGTQFLKSNGSGILSWGSALLSVTGTANQVTANTVSGAVTLSLPADVVVSDSLTVGDFTIADSVNGGNLTSSLNLSLICGSGGNVALKNSATASGLLWYNTAGSRYVGFRVPSASIASNILWQLPNTDSTGTQALVSNGSGVLSWATPGGVASITGTADQIDVSSSTGAVTLSLSDDVTIVSSLEIGGNLNLSSVGEIATDGPMVLRISGANAFNLKNSDNAASLRWYNTAGTFYSGFKVGNPSSNVVWTLPETDSTGTQALVSNGSGVLSWSSDAGGVDSLTGTANQITVSSSTGNITLSLPSTVFIGSDSDTELQLSAQTIYCVDQLNLNSETDVVLYAAENIFLSTPSGGSVLLISPGGGGSVVPLRFFNTTKDHFVGLQAGVLSADTSWTLPVADSSGTQFLISNGSGAMGWATPVTTITGTANQITASASTGAVTLSLPSNVAIVNSLAVGGSGSDKTLTISSDGTFCTIGTNSDFLLDASGDIYLTSNAVDGDVFLYCAGTGSVNFQNTTGDAETRWYTQDTTHYVSFKIGSGLSTSTTWTLPVADSSGTQALVSNGSGVLSWSSTVGGVTSITGTADQITASASTGAVTLSLPSDVVVSNSLTAELMYVGGESTGNELQLSPETINCQSQLNLTSDMGIIVSSVGIIHLATGYIHVGSLAGTNIVPVRFYNSTNTNFVALQAGGLSTDTTWTLPTTDSTGTQYLKSNGSGALSWGTPVTTITGTSNRLTASASTGAVTLDISSSYVGQASITTLGTIGTGVWQGTPITGTFGGTGVNNASRTITIAGNLVTSGANSLTLTTTGTTNVTLPTTGTLLTSAGAVTNIAGTANQVTASASVGAVTLSLPDTATSTNFTGEISDSSGHVFGSATCTYIKILGSYFVNIDISWPNKGSAVSGDDVRISLPFFTPTVKSGLSLYWMDGAKYTAQQMFCGCDPGQAYLTFPLLNTTTGAMSHLTVAGLNASGEFILSGWIR